MSDSSLRFIALRQWVLAHPSVGLPAFLSWMGLSFLVTGIIFRRVNMGVSEPVVVSDRRRQPAIGGLGLAALTGGKAQVLDLAHRLFDWRRIPGRWWLVILLFWLCLEAA